MIIRKLYEATQNKKTSLKSFLYRHKKLLSSPCKNIPCWPFPLSSREIEISRALIQCAFLQVDDFESKDDQRILREWKNFPKDPNFFKMLLRQNEIWTSFLNDTLIQFLESPEVKAWIKASKNLKRRPLFELDSPFKPAKQQALSNEETIVRLLRQNPLLRYSDLKRMEMKNAQKIIEKFEPLENLRFRYLDKLKKTFVAQ